MSIFLSDFFESFNNYYNADYFNIPLIFIMLDINGTTTLFTRYGLVYVMA